MDTDKLLSIFELILKKDERDALERKTQAIGQSFPPPQSSIFREQDAVDTAIGDVGNCFDWLFHQLSIHDLPDQAYPATLSPPRNMAWYQEKFEKEKANIKNVIERVISPELGVAIPLEWLEPVDVLADFVKHDAAALASLDAMVKNWLRIERYEPNAGDSFSQYKMKSVGDQIGFVVETCVKRGWKYVGNAPYNPGRLMYEGIISMPIVKIKDGVSPPENMEKKLPEFDGSGRKIVYGNEL